MIVHPGPDTSAWAETITSPEIVATINGEPLYSDQVFRSKKSRDFFYFADHDSSPTRSNLEEYQNYMRLGKKRSLVHSQGTIIEILRNQWIEQQGIAVTDEELEAAWQNSSARKKFLKNFDLEKWEKEKVERKVRYTSYREALDPKHFPKEVYQPSQIEDYTKYLKKVHKKFYENRKETSYSDFSVWAVELLGWAGVPQKQWTSFEEKLNSKGGLKKHQFQNMIKNRIIENRVLGILAKTDPELKRCLDKHPQKNIETPSKDRRRCSRGKIRKFWKTIYQKADIQIHDPELAPVLDLIRKP